MQKIYKAEYPAHLGLDLLEHVLDHGADVVDRLADPHRPVPHLHREVRGIYKSLFFTDFDGSNFFWSLYLLSTTFTVSVVGLPEASINVSDNPVTDLH